jgi:hypothetical protein
VRRAIYGVRDDPVKHLHQERKLVHYPRMPIARKPRRIWGENHDTAA